MATYNWGVQSTTVRIKQGGGTAYYNVTGSLPSNVQFNFSYQSPINNVGYQSNQFVVGIRGSSTGTFTITAVPSSAGNTFNPSFLELTLIIESKLVPEWDVVWFTPGYGEGHYHEKKSEISLPMKIGYITNRGNHNVVIQTAEWINIDDDATASIGITGDPDGIYITWMSCAVNLCSTLSLRIGSAATSEYIAKTSQNTFAFFDEPQASWSTGISGRTRQMSWVSGSNIIFTIAGTDGYDFRYVKSGSGANYFNYTVETIDYNNKQITLSATGSQFLGTAAFTIYTDDGKSHAKSEWITIQFIAADQTWTLSDITFTDTTSTTFSLANAVGSLSGMTVNPDVATITINSGPRTATINKVGSGNTVYSISAGGNQYYNPRTTSANIYAYSGDKYVWIYGNFNNSTRWHKAIPYVYGNFNNTTTWHKAEAWVYNNGDWRSAATN